jgi:hypothetical protein
MCFVVVSEKRKENTLAHGNFRERPFQPTFPLAGACSSALEKGKTQSQRTLGFRMNNKLTGKPSPLFFAYALIFSTYAVAGDSGAKWLQRDTLTGDWSGSRKQLARRWPASSPSWLDITAPSRSSVVNAA